jgi:alanyl-tRNA synthetase
MATSAEIRQQFIDYFRAKHEHTFVPSSPVVPHDDPSLLFTNAGMNQFKDVFLATGSREYQRAVNSQKCIRAGGKHNDLEDVGKDTYHHTFFEMLGNWSFGDYFKAEAIRWAWDLLTNVWGLEKDRLHATVFEGDQALGLEPDHEAAELWQSETDIDPSHIHYAGKEDNFWEMGDTGPCGPCSEIHIDRTPDKSGADKVNQDHPQVIEIWNLVFIQFNKTAGGELKALPNKHVDTGMGFERICAVLQGKTSNYDTDVFTPLFDKIQQVTGARAYGQATGDAHESLNDPIDTAYRVIADHVRCLTFALTDGAVPSNEGRGYVLRRILRRAVRHGRQTLGVHQPFLCDVVPAVVETMSGQFAELKKNPDRVREIIREEEESFGRTIDRGIELFEQAAYRSETSRDRKGAVITGDDAFTLYDTYGFPLDLTQVMAEERGMTVDVERFNELMEQRREQSRAGMAGGDARQSLVDIVQQGELPETEFIGYERNTEVAGEVTPVHLFKEGEHTYERVEQAKQGDAVAVVVARTPFYAEAGGQVGDQGVIQIEKGGRVNVTDTIKVGQTTFHLGTVASDVIESSDKATVALAVDKVRREKTMANHTATHMLNKALRDHVNAEADQKGSLVDPDKLRFDFSNTAALNDDELQTIEQQVNADIEADMAVDAAVAPQEKGRSIYGLRAVFGEKYPDHVRIVSIGQPVHKLLEQPGNPDWGNYSIEFCGGTHLNRTGEAERFVIVNEEGVAKGVRRVVALTGEAATIAEEEGEQLLHRLQSVEADGESAEQDRLSKEVSALNEALHEKTLPLRVRSQIRAGVGRLQETIKKLSKKQAEAAQADVVERARQIADEAEGPVIVEAIEGADGKTLRKAMDVIRKKRPDCALLLAGASGDKVAIVAAVPEALQGQGLKAGDWVGEVAPVVGGGGGGKPDMAQAGGKEPGKINDALEKARDVAAAKVG